MEGPHQASRLLHYFSQSQQNYSGYMYPGPAPGYPPHTYDYHDYMNGAEGYYPAHYDPQGYTHDHHHPAFSHPAFSSPRSDVSGEGGGPAGAQEQGEPDLGQWLEEEEEGGPAGGGAAGVIASNSSNSSNGNGAGSSTGEGVAVPPHGEAEVFDDVDRSEFDRYLKGPERVSAVATTFTYTPPANTRYLQVGGGQYQDSQFTALIKEEPEDYSITSEATKSTDASCHSPDAAKPDTNTSSLLSALADVRELYYEHS
ncbi:uncharacterized protein LOC119591712 [Penaeus monodon]|uniref:uncharacterized protein LOC119591712 n=1 Tax=Penaeus monodon TaxID=6687 RepID=UPI0018A6F399|nr:uncharacterized protein LOC119591712 [Penaeus monodon]